ncbi:hypothetical protein J4856_03510 [Prevotella scopos JCM 17725]|uniref:Lipoprotein n=2 Tax=Prevotella TaxID=838 RepID=A0AAX2F0J4_9BACT|nr:hypothetical protein AXF22_08285 [Prevotella scopos JCM 17725]QUB44090.1 hypothetical protein J4856_03510 [Prevotella scopos JCM 17725]SHF53734.1 hypothetical protein SAMN05444364_10127 [Prevotella scopos JCM 17725]
MKTILLIFSCLLLFCCTTKTRKVTTVHSPYDTVYVYPKDETGQKIYNVISEKAVMDNGDPLFGKIRTEVPKQLNDKEFELAKSVVRKYIHGHQDEFLPFDCYFQQYLGYKKEGVLMADVALFSDYRVIYQKGVAGITREDYRVNFRFLKDLGKERKRLTINLDKGIIVNE